MPETRTAYAEGKPKFKVRACAKGPTAPIERDAPPFVQRCTLYRLVQTHQSTLRSAASILHPILFFFESITRGFSGALIARPWLPDPRARAVLNLVLLKVCIPAQLCRCTVCLNLHSRGKPC